MNPCQLCQSPCPGDSFFPYVFPKIIEPMNRLEDGKHSGDVVQLDLSRH